MNIYVGHPSSIHYREEVYKPIKESSIHQEHTVTLPHEKSEEPFDSKEYLANSCQLFIAEVSDASTGLGMEMAWADEYDVPILCVYKDGKEISSSIPVVAQDVRSYDSEQELIDTIKSYLNELQH